MLRGIFLSLSFLFLFSCGPAQPITTSLIGAEKRHYMHKGSHYCYGLDRGSGVYSYYGCEEEYYSY